MAIVLTDLGTQVKNEGKVEESIEHYKHVSLFFTFFCIFLFFFIIGPCF